VTSRRRAGTESPTRILARALPITLTLSLSLTLPIPLTLTLPLTPALTLTRYEIDLAGREGASANLESRLGFDESVAVDQVRVRARVRVRDRVRVRVRVRVRGEP